MRTIEVLACAAALLAVSGALPAQDIYTPSATRVAILPSVNVSQEHDKKQTGDQAKWVDNALREEFASRGFVLVDRDAVRKAIEDQKLDMSDEENHRRATVLQVGKAAGADVAVFAAVMDVEQVLDNGHLGGDDAREGKAKLKVWVMDVRTEKPLLSAKVLTAKSRPWMIGFERGSTLMRHACARAVRDGLKETLKPYPVQKAPKEKP